MSSVLYKHNHSCSFPDICQWNCTPCRKPANRLHLGSPRLVNRVLSRCGKLPAGKGSVTEVLCLKWPCPAETYELPLKMWGKADSGLVYLFNETSLDSRFTNFERKIKARMTVSLTMYRGPLFNEWVNCTSFPHLWLAWKAFRSGDMNLKLGLEITKRNILSNQWSLSHIAREDLLCFLYPGFFTNN